MVYQTRGVCSKEIHFEIDDNNKIRDIVFVGGCNGNLQGICALVKGMDADEVIQKFSGISCCGRGTSCPDQLARALRAAKQR